MYGRAFVFGVDIAMRLLSMIYNGSTMRNMLCLELGQQDDKLCIIETSKIDEISRELIKSSSKELDKLSFGLRIAWIREHCPAAMSGYKTLLIAKAQILDTYDI